jgi:hypothetical protein
MKVKILKSKGQDFWYKNKIGKYIDIGDTPIITGKNNEFFVIYETPLGENGNTKYIFINDTNYNSIIRKMKIKNLKS